MHISTRQLIPMRMEMYGFGPLCLSQKFVLKTPPIF